MKENDQLGFLDRLAALRETLVANNVGQIAATPQFADQLLNQVETLYEQSVDADRAATPPPDKGLANLAGIGGDAATQLGDTRVPPGPKAYDETVTSERMVAVADLYYLYQHERLGVFRVVRKLKELFHAGAVRLSSGEGAFKLYQFDRRDALRYTQAERTAAYRRAFGYGAGSPGPSAQPNLDFHHLFTHFTNQVGLYWRDKRISDVMRERALDPSFGSVAIVRRAGLDLRNNMKFTSFGHLNVLRVEAMQLLEEAFAILNANDVKNLFGVDTGWDVIEEVLVRYFNEQLVTSPRQRMGETGRDLLRWLAQKHILNPQRIPFESLLLQIAEPAEEWLTSAQSLGVAGRLSQNQVLPWDRAQGAMNASGAANARRPMNGAPSRGPRRRRTIVA